MIRQRGTLEYLVGAHIPGSRAGPRMHHNPKSEYINFFSPDSTRAILLKSSEQAP